MDNTHAVNSPNTGPPTREKHEPWKAYCVDLPDTLTNWVNLSRKPLLKCDPCVWWKAYWQLYSLHLSVVLGVLVLQKLKQCYYRHLVAYKWTLVQTNISIMIRERLVGQEFVWCMPDTTMSMKKEKLYSHRDVIQSMWNPLSFCSAQAATHLIRSDRCAAIIAEYSFWYKRKTNIPVLNDISREEVH